MKLKVDTRKLVGNVEELTNIISGLEADLDEMYAAIDKLDGMWDGPANEVFKKAFDADAQYMLNVVDNLVDLTDCISYAENEYEKANGTVYEIVSSIKIREY